MSLTKDDIGQIRQLVGGYLSLDKTATELTELQQKVAAVVEHDVAYAYDTGFLDRAQEAGLDQKEAMAAYDIARQREASEA